MPSYPWLAVKKIDYLNSRKKLSVMKKLGVPYEQDVVANADIHAQKQADDILKGLVEQDPSLKRIKDTQVLAMIAYMQSLGKKTEKIVQGE